MDSCEKHNRFIDVDYEWLSKLWVTFGMKPIINPTARKKHSDVITKFYRFLKDKKRYIMVAVKILNHEGFVITAYQTLKIQKEE